MINAPIYRAKEIDSEDYVEGFYFKEEDSYHWILTGEMNDWGECFDSVKHEIDISTLAINFPDMKDSNDKPIFASLSESGKGGDNISLDGSTCFTAVFTDGTVQIVRKWEWHRQCFKGLGYLKERRIIGIQDD